MTCRFCGATIAIVLMTRVASAGVDVESFTIEPSVPGTQVFRTIGVQGIPRPDAGPGATASWPASVDLALLDTLPSALQVNFADRESVTLSRLRSARRGPTSLMWTGRGGECGALFSRVANTLRATISCVDGQYGLDGLLDTGLHLNRYDDAGADFEEPLADMPPAWMPKEEAQASGKGTDATVDVLVLFNGSLTSTNIWSFAQYAIDQTQLAMDLSTSPGQPPIAELRLAGAARISRTVYNAPSSDLVYLETAPEVLALRNYGAADVVVYITLGTGPAQGIAYIPGYSGSPLPGPAFAPRALAVSLSGYATNPGDYVFAHEFAHTFGANHNPDEVPANPTPIRSWAWGHWARENETNWGSRTIMSYVDECTGNPCPRLLHYSNPDVWAGWFRTGLAARDNARLLEEIVPIQAQYRASLGRIFAHGFD